jgi:hypothetical protein
MARVVAAVLAGAVGAALLGPAWAGEKASLIQGPSGSKSDNLEVKAGGLVVREGAVGSAFGTVRLGAGKPALSYFVVLKHGLSGTSSSESEEKVSAADHSGESEQTVTIDGKKLTVGYAVTLDPKTKKVVKEALKVNGTELDAAKGRVLVVDLTAAPPKWEQKKLKLPADVPDAGEKKAAEELAQKVLASLAKQDKAVKALLAAGR